MRDFNLQTDPFEEGAGRRFYFDAPGFAARHEAILGAIEDGDVLLVDEAGSGKSTALDRFAAATAAHMRVFFVRVHAAHDAKALSNALVSALGLPLREPVAAELRDADAFFELLGGRGQLAVVVIDDAHRLEGGALEQLVYLSKRWERYRVRFLIGAEPELCERLEGLDAAVPLLGRTMRMAMPRLDAEQVGDYLNICLYRAGLSGDSPFDAERVSRVAARARGLVGAVAPAAREILDECMRADAQTQRLPARRRSLALAAGAAFALLAVLAFPWKTPSGATSLEAPESRPGVTHADQTAFRSSIATRRLRGGEASREGSPSGGASGVP